MEKHLVDVENKGVDIIRVETIPSRNAPSIEAIRYGAGCVLDQIQKKFWF